LSHIPHVTIFLQLLEQGCIVKIAYVEDKCSLYISYYDNNVFSVLKLMKNLHVVPRENFKLTFP